MSEETIAQQIKEAEDSEGAEKKRNQAIEDAVNKAGIVTGKQIGRASCRERVSSPV